MLVPMLKGSFTSGEFSPRMTARNELDRYKNGAIQLENLVVLLQGGVTRRPGTRFVAQAAYANRLCLVRAFEPSTTDAYILEIGHLYMRFYKQGARLETSPGTPVEIATPYLDTDLRLLRTAQSNDVMILVHPSYAPRRLSRLNDTTWVLSLLTFDPPPLYEAGEAPAIVLTLSALTGTAITITAASPYWLQADVQRGLTAGVGRAVITSYTSPTVVVATVLDAFTSFTLAAGAWTLRRSPVASLETTVAGPSGALTTLSLTGGGTNLVTNGTFDDATGWTDVSTGGCSAEVTGGQGVLTFPGSGATSPDVAILETIVTPLIIGQEYTIQFDNIAVGDSREPVAIQVGTASGLDDLGRSYFPVGYNIQLQFTATTTTIYLALRGNSHIGVSAVDNLSMFPTRLDGWRVGDVNKYVHAGDAYVQLTQWLSAQQMTGRIVQAFPSRDPVTAGAWTLESPAWTDTLGWPSAVVLYEGRLFFAGSSQFPQTLWGSAIDDLFNFALGTTAAAGVRFSLVDSGGNITLNRIRWLMPSENLLVGTTHGEYRLIGSVDDPLSATSPPRNRIQSTFGSDIVQPLKVGASILFTQRQGSKMREMTYSIYTQTNFVARDITVNSEHLLAKERIVELAYQQEPLSVIWALRSDGVLLGLTYDGTEQITAWWRATTAGAFQSVASIPHPTANANQVWVSVTRTIGGVARQTIEYLDAEARMVLPEPVAMFNELTQETEQVDGWDGLTVDSATVYEGISTATLTGLGHLEGETVTIVGDGAVFPPQVVNAGQITLPQVVHTAFVGLPYLVRGRTLPVEVARPGVTGQGSRKRWTNLTARVQNTASLVLQNEKIPWRQPHMPQNQGPAVFTGDRVVNALGYDTYGMISFVVPDPLPCTIIAVYGTLDVET